MNSPPVLNQQMFRRLFQLERRRHNVQLMPGKESDVGQVRMRRDEARRIHLEGLERKRLEREKRKQDPA